MLMIGDISCSNRIALTVQHKTAKLTIW